MKASIGVVKINAGNSKIVKRILFLKSVFLFVRQVSVNFLGLKKLGITNNTIIPRNYYNP